MPDVESIFFAAIQKPTPGDRSAYLDDACGGDADLRGRVERLLAAQPQVGSFLEQPAEAVGTAHFPGGDAAGTVLAGRYTLVEPIGEGGMGEVWVAKQAEPVKRKVAVKLIKAGMDSKAVLARFEAERQALALMDHPNIAKVLDGGLTPDRRPFFVMELVNGLPLTKFCDQAKLGVRERLELFVAVCQAVQHAHQKGVIHRDLKPSNVLVTVVDGRGMPKVIDFGVAKAVGGRLTDESLSTQFGAVVGTLEYMSPEQAGYSGQDIDTRADVYSLGVILYELLTGLRPHDGQRLRQAALAEMVRILREEEPSKPSTRLSSDAAKPSLAALRGTDPKRLAALLRGELDWVVMKALEKDRSRRYETANALARDVQRHLADEPVEACPPSAAYRLAKFVRRNRGRVAAAALVLLALVGGIVGMSWQALRATRAEAAALKERDAADAARARADRNLQKAREAIDAYLKLADDPTLKNTPHSTDVRKRLLATALPFFKEFVREAGDDAAVRFDRGKAYLQLGRVRAEMGEEAAADRDLTAARDIFDRLATESPSTPEYRFQLAATLNRMARRRFGGRSLAAQREALALLDALAAEFPATREYRDEQASGYYWYYRLTGRTTAGVPIRRSVAIRERLVDDFPTEPAYRSRLAYDYNQLGLSLRSSERRPAEAEVVHRRALDILMKLLAESPGVPEYRYDLARSHNGLGLALHALGKFAEAEAEYRRALDVQRRLADDFPAVPMYRDEMARHYDNIGVVTSDLRRPFESEEAHRQALDIWETLVAAVPTTPEYRDRAAYQHDRLGRLFGDRGRPAEAEASYRRAIAIRAKLAAKFPGEPEFRTYTFFNEGRFRNTLAASQNGLGSALGDQGRWVDAAAVLRESLDFRQAMEPDAWTTFETKSVLGGVLLGQGKLADAEPLLVASYAGMKERLDAIPREGKARLPEAALRLVRLYEALGRPAEAARWLDEAWAWVETPAKP
ncbi:MAG: protein kinase [Gemmataceae bacterium]